jgi:hypothetical protein
MGKRAAQSCAKKTKTTAREEPMTSQNEFTREDEATILRIIEPEECDGVYTTRKAFYSLPWSIREHLATQFDPEPDTIAIFRRRKPLVRALLSRTLTRTNDDVDYVFSAALAEVLKQLSKAKRR